MLIINLRYSQTYNSHNYFTYYKTTKCIYIKEVYLVFYVIEYIYNLFRWQLIIQLLYNIWKSMYCKSQHRNTLSSQKYQNTFDFRRFVRRWEMLNELSVNIRCYFPAKIDLESRGWLEYIESGNKIKNKNNIRDHSVDHIGENDWVQKKLFTAFRK